MEPRYDEIDIPRLAGCCSAETLIEGSIPFPEGRRGRLLTAQGSVEMLPGALVKDGLVIAEGRVTVELICCGAEDDAGTEALVCFTSGAQFRHTLALPEAQEGMSAGLCAAISSLSLTEGGTADSLALAATVELSCRVLDESPQKILRGAQGCPDMELKTRLVESSTVLPSSSCMRLREEISAPNVTSVLCARACVLPGERGTLCLDILCRDKDGETVQLQPQISFEYEAPHNCCKTRVTALLVRCAEEFGLLILEAQLELCCREEQPACAELTECAYSPSTPFCCEVLPLCFIGGAGSTCEVRTLRESVDLPEDAEKLVCCRAQPLITAKSITEGRLYLEGLLQTHFVYVDNGGRFQGFSQDVSFSCDLPAPCATLADVDCCCCAEARGRGRADVCYTLGITAGLWAVQEATAAVGASPCEPTATPHGLYLYFASEGETVFDVARRFNVPRSRLCRADGQAPSETLTEGSRLMLLI